MFWAVLLLAIGWPFSANSMHFKSILCALTMAFKHILGDSFLGQGDKGRLCFVPCCYWMLTQRMLNAWALTTVFKHIYSFYKI